MSTNLQGTDMDPLQIDVQKWLAEIMHVDFLPNSLNIVLYYV